MRNFPIGRRFSPPPPGLLGTHLTASVMVEGLGGCTIQVGAKGSSSRCFSVSLFIYGGLSATLGVSPSVATGGVEPGSDAEGIG